MTYVCVPHPNDRRALFLDENPLGQPGVVALFRALQVNTTLRHLQLTNASLATRPGEPAPTLDPVHPNGTYSLDLAKADQRKVRAVRSA